MLKIFIDEISNEARNLELINDVEKLFAQLRIEKTNLNMQIISLIEKGKYNDENSFIDRFGYKLYISELSTGCKAALCVVNCPEKLINLVECGNNARDIIISLCKQGNILLKDNGIFFKSYASTIEAEVDGYKFENIDNLNKYVFAERPFPPSHIIGGTNHV